LRLLLLVRPREVDGQGEARACRVFAVATAALVAKLLVALLPARAAGLSGGRGPATAAQLSGPTGVAPTADGDFLIADTSNHRIRYVDADLRSPKGEQGEPGAQGAQGPPGADRGLLAAAIAADKTTTKRRKAKVRIVTTLPGTATLEAKPKGKSRRAAAAKKAKTRTATKELASAGRHTLKLKKLKPGTSYKLTLVVSSADGQEASDTAKLKVRKKRRR
jgi:hypothetical protein